MRRLCFPSYDAQLVWNHDAVPLSTSEWSITKLSVTVVDKPADPTESTEDLFEEPLNNPVTVSSKQSDFVNASPEQFLQQIRFASVLKVAFTIPTAGLLIAVVVLSLVTCWSERTLELRNASSEARREDLAEAEGIIATGHKSNWVCCINLVLQFIQV